MYTYIFEPQKSQNCPGTLFADEIADTGRLSVGWLPTGSSDDLIKVAENH